MPPPETSIQQGNRSERRQHARHLMHVPVYATLNGCNGGLLLDLSATGMGVQAVAPLHDDETILLHFELQRPRTRIEAAARVAWASPSGQAGLRFAGMSPQTQRSLQGWLTSTAAGSRAANRLQPEFFPGANQEPGEEPTVERALPVMAAETETLPADQAKSVDIPLWPRPISLRALVSLTDAMIVLLAVLLFAVISVSTSGVAPGWPLWVISAVVLTGFFGFLYRYLFATYARGTAGQHLAGWEPEKNSSTEASGSGSTQ